MVQQLRSTLPKNFEDLLADGDEAAVLAVFDTCEVNARGGYWKCTALGFATCPAVVARWLVDHGADVEAVDSGGMTPLHRHAGAWNGQPRLLLDLGANIESVNKQGETALHVAAGRHRVQTVRLLVERGANVSAEARRGLTPAATAVKLCENATIAETAEILEILVAAGAVLTEDLRADAARIGKQFEFHRDNFNQDSLPAADAGLQKIYELLKASPVQRRRMHDGSSNIVVTGSTWQDQHRELWDLLVPSQGAAVTVQGEVIRITGRISDEIERNGGGNWDRDFQRMADALPEYLSSSTPLDADDLKAARNATRLLKGRKRLAVDHPMLSEYAVRWVRENPQPIPLTTPKYRR
ncbi:Ankyrin repeat [Agreia bicolorata]|uniref:Ankyrin repeat n=1 Tax=Agreia bicolorata TaxID=110935 RepID=A0A1T4Y2K0_9MICO|nr:ankyrin repeat domain-containing protein [Agreia bicolorata]SKA95970.1 Ankyrin repeat [Agreia bicolorata]